MQVPSFVLGLLLRGLLRLSPFVCLIFKEGYTVKLYEGFLPKASDVGPRPVYVTDRPGNGGPLEHHIRHSPDGFSWGYSGSGPAELAMCILWDYFGAEPHAVLYQKFKEDCVAKWGHEDWTLSSDAIVSWLRLNKDIPRCVTASGVA